MPKHCLIILSLILFQSAWCQETDKYRDVDDLIATGSMIDAMNAIRTLQNDHAQDSTDAEYWLRYSKASYTYYKYEDAVNAINKAIALKPKESVYYFEKGLLLNRIQNLDSSLVALSKAISLKKEGNYYYWRGIVNQQLKNNEDAEKDYVNAISNGFETAEMYNNLAILCIDKGENERALGFINGAIRLNSMYPQAYSARSKINILLGNIDSACVDMKSAHQLGYYKTFELPDSICNGSEEAKLNYAAEALVTIGQYKNAAVLYSLLIDKNYRKSDYYLNRGYSYFKTQKYAEAERDYQKALTSANPDEYLLYENLSLLYFDMKNYEKSIEYSNKLIQMKPDDPVNYGDRGLAYRKLKKYKEAENDFNKSIALKPDNFRAYGSRSYMYLEQGHYEKALEDAQKSVDINPQYDYGYLMLAQSKLAMGIQDYCVDFEKAKALGNGEAQGAINKYCK